MPTQHHTRTPKPKAGSVVIVHPSSRGPVVFHQENALEALDLLTRWVSRQCLSGDESVWVYQRRQWAPLGQLRFL